MTEYLCTYISDLKLALVTIYRPPSCTSNSFRKCLDEVDDWLRKMTSKKNETKIIINGDFNLGFLESWDEDKINDFCS